MVIISYVRDINTYVRNINTYVRDKISYVPVRDVNTYVRDNYLVRTWQLSRTYVILIRTYVIIILYVRNVNTHVPSMIIPAILT